MEKYDFKYETNGQTRIQLSVIKGSSYRYLWHEELELMAVLSGELEYFASQKSYHLKAGDMLFFPSNCGHSIISSGKSDAQSETSSQSAYGVGRLRYIRNAGYLYTGRNIRLPYEVPGVDRGHL